LPVKPPIVKARIRKVEECVVDLEGYCRYVVEYLGL
jgi:hypothetical protein